MAKPPAKKPVKKHSLAERKALRAKKRKEGPSAVRRRERREALRKLVVGVNEEVAQAVTPKE